MGQRTDRDASLGPPSAPARDRSATDDPSLALIDAVAVGIARFDDQGILRLCNQRFARLIGRDRESIAGQSLGTLLPGRGVSNGLPRTSFRVQSETEPDRELQAVLAPLDPQLGNAAGLVCTLFDITEHAQAGQQHRLTEAALRNSEATLKEAQRIAHIGNWELDLKSRRLIWSDEVYRIFEIEPRAFSGRFEEFLQGVHPDDREDIDGKLSAAARARVSLITVHRLRMADGRVKFVQERAEVVCDHSGEPVSLKGTVQDVTERRRLEDRMQRNLAVLERAGRINTLGEMATSIAHELNQPLMAIGNYAGGAIERLRRSEAADPALLRALERIAEIAERSGDIVKWIRSFVGQRAMQKGRVDINAVIGEGLFLARPEARRNNILIREALAPSLPPVNGGSVNLQQVIVNLVLNAVEASGDTPAALREILVATDLSDDGDVQISVADHGSGLAPEVLNNLFQPFVTTKPDGIGMGLSIVRTIVEDHGGRIEAGPNSPRGTVFRVRLPAARGEQA